RKKKREHKKSKKEIIRSYIALHPQAISSTYVGRRNVSPRGKKRLRSGSVWFDLVPFGPITIDFDNRLSISGGINRERKMKRESKKREKMEIIFILSRKKKREKMKIIRSGVGLPLQVISSPCTGRKTYPRVEEVTRYHSAWLRLISTIVGLFRAVSIEGERRRGRRWKLFDPILVFPRERFLLPARYKKRIPCRRSNEAMSPPFF
ncbi:hypothetical protein B296_00040421, partial [Ensete ventricosum]